MSIFFLSEMEHMETIHTFSLSDSRTQAQGPSVSWVAKRSNKIRFSEYKTKQRSEEWLGRYVQRRNSR